MTADRITILRCERGRRATKRWFLDPYTGKPKLEGYDAGMSFAAESAEVDGIRDLSALLTRLERDPRALAIRGELLPGVDPRRVRRLKHRRDNAGPCFAEPVSGRRWVLIDFDKVPIPAHIDLVDDPEGAVEYLVGLLPDAFQDVSYHWQLSSSAGMGDLGVLSAHLWFCLDRPITEAELRRWATTIAVPIDRSLFNEVQPHFTAAPIFEAGVRDPLPRRSGLRIGLEDAVQLVVPDPAPRRAPPGSTGAGEGLGAAAGFEAKLALLGNGEGLAGFYEPLLTAVWAYVREHRVDGTDGEALKARLREAIDAAPKRPGRDEDIARYMSDRFLDDLIVGALDKWSPTLATAMPPHWPNAPLPLSEAVGLLDRTVDRFLDETLAGKKPRIGIKGAAAIGKTGAVIRALGARPGIRELSIEVYAPDHKLTAEWANRLRDKAPDLRVQVIYGRSHEDRRGTLCARALLAEDVARAGMGVYETLCKRTVGDLSGGRFEECPYFRRCTATRYLAQFRDAGPAVRIMAHANLPLPRGRLLPKPEIIIIDETFWREAVETRRSIGIDRLTAARPARQFGRSGGGSLKTAFNLAGQATKVRDALLEGRPLLAELRQAGHTRETLADMTRAEHATIDALNLSPAMSDDEIRRKLDGLNRGEIFARARLWKILRDEIDTGREQAHGVELRCNVPIKGGERQDRVFLHHRRPLPRLSGIAVLLLDADLNREIAGQLVPGVEVVEIAVERRAEVIQVHNTRCSKRRLLGAQNETDQKRAGRHVDEIRNLITTEAADGRKVLVVTYKPVRRLLTGEDADGSLAPGAPLKESQLPVEVAHFGGIRGQDRWRSYDIVIVVGRHQPPILEIEALGRALYYDRAEPLTFLSLAEGGQLTLASERRGYRLRHGRADVEVEAHPDPDIQALLEQLREAEMVQAVDRLRLIHNDTPKRVVIVSNLVLDLTVDLLRPWRDVMPTKLRLVALSADAFPLSTRELARCFPQVWSSGAAARADLRRLGLNRAESLMEYILGFRPYLSRAEYRRPGEPGRPVQALVSGPPGRARETLSSVVGPLSSFRLVEAGPSSVAPARVAPELKPTVGAAAQESEVAPALPPEVVEVEPPSTAAVFRCGIVPPDLRAWSRARRRAAGISQEAVARRIGVSRPQLANAEAGRFGLSTETAARFLATIAGLPERQAGLRF